MENVEIDPERQSNGVGAGEGELDPRAIPEDDREGPDVEMRPVANIRVVDTDLRFFNDDPNDVRILDEHYASRMERGGDSDDAASLLSEYTEDTDSSDDEELDMRNPAVSARVPLQNARTSVRETLAMHKALASRKASAAEDRIDSWLFQVPMSAAALEHRSCLLIPPFHSLRIVLYNLTHHRYYELALAAIIVANCILIATETPRLNTNSKPGYQFFTEGFFAFFFSFEMVVKVITLGAAGHPGAYARSPWNLLDAAVVVLAWLAVFVDNFGNYTPIRLLRVLKTLRMMHVDSALNIVIHAFLTAFRPLVGVLLLLFIVVWTFALVAVQLWMGLANKRCTHEITGAVLDSRPCSYDAAARIASESSQLIFWGRLCPQGYECTRLQSTGPLGQLHYDNLGAALFAVFAATSFDNWGALIADRTYDTMSMLCFFFFFPLLLLGGYYIPSVISAFVIGHLRSARAHHDDKVMQKFQEVKRDHQLTKAMRLRLRRQRRPSTASAALSPNEREQRRRREYARRTAMIPAKAVERLTTDETLQLRLAFLEHFGAVQQSVVEDEAAALPCESEVGNNRFKLPKPTGDNIQLFAGTNTVASINNRLAFTHVLGSSRPSSVARTRPSTASRSEQQNSKTLRNTIMFSRPQSAVPRPGSVQPPMAPFEATETDVEPIMVQDPAGGDIRAATSRSEAFDVLLNTVHAFVEGYPRIVSRYVVLQSQLDKEDKIPPQFQPTALRRMLRRRRQQAPSAASAVEEEDVDESIIEMTPLEVAQRIRSYSKPTIFTWLVAACVVVDTAFLAAKHINMLPSAFEMVNVVAIICTAIFAFELFLRFAALGPRLWARDWMNLFDLLVVVFALIEFGIVGSASVSVFRAVRLLRLVKVLRLTRARQMSRILLKATSFVASILTLLGVFVFMFLLIGMQFLHGRLEGLGDSYGKRLTFKSFLDALFAIMAVVTRDDWVPLTLASMEVSNAGIVFFFLLVYIITNFVILPLFLATFVMLFDEDELGDGEPNKVGILMVATKDQYFSYLQAKAVRRKMEALPYLTGQDPSKVIFLSPEMTKTLRMADPHTAATGNPIHNDVTFNRLSRPSTTGSVSPGALLDTVATEYGEEIRLRPRGTCAEVLLTDEDGVQLAPVLPAAPGRVQRTPLEIYEGQRDAIRLRRTKQGVLESIRDFVDEEVQNGTEPTHALLTLILGQLWSSGLLLRITADDVSEPSEITGRLSWDVLLDEMEDEQAVLDLQVGEEQVGRSQSSIIAARFASTSSQSRLLELKDDCMQRSLFVFSLGNPIRAALLDITSSITFELSIFGLILISCLILALFNPRYPDGFSDSRHAVLEGLDKVFVVLFTIEAVTKIVANGLVLSSGSYLRSSWNIVDGAVVVLCIASWASPTLDVQYVKALRLFRVLRLTRLVWFPRETRVVTVALLRSVKGIASAAVFIAVNYVVWAVCGLQIWAGRLNRCTNPAVTTFENCTGPFVQRTYMNGTAVVPVIAQAVWYTEPRNFDNMGNALLSIVEVGSGEWWIDLLYAGTDATGRGSVMRADYAPYKGLFFVLVVLVTNYVMYRLLGGIVVFNYNVVCRQANGSLLMNRAQRNWMNAQRLLLKITPGAVLLPLANPISKAAARVSDSPHFLSCRLVVILVNALFISLVHFEMNDTYRSVTRATNVIFLIAHWLLMLVPVAAFGPRYVRRRWHLYDFLLNVLVLIDVCLQESGTGDRGLHMNFNIFRLLRLTDTVIIVHGFSRLRGLGADISRVLRVFLGTIAHSFVGVLSVAGILFITFFCSFSIIGVHAFATIHTGTVVNEHRYPNFNSFISAVQVVFRMASGEDWDRLMRDAMVAPAGCSGHNCGSTLAPLFFVPLFIVLAHVGVYMAIAVVIESHEAVRFLEEGIMNMGQVKRLIALWRQLDPNGSNLIPTQCLPQLLEDLRPPCGILRAACRSELLAKLREYGIPDHGGYVHFTEVLLPVARRACGVQFSPSQIKAQSERWKAYVKSLEGLPVVRLRNQECTADQAILASYVAATHKRRIGRLVVQEALRERQRGGREACESQRLDSSVHGFAGRRFDVPEGDAITDPFTLRAIEIYTARENGDPLPVSAMVEGDGDDVGEGLAPARAVGVDGSGRVGGAAGGAGGERRPNPLIGCTPADIDEIRRLGRQPTREQLLAAGIIDEFTDSRMTPLYDTARLREENAKVRSQQRASRLLMEMQEGAELAGDDNDPSGGDGGEYHQPSARVSFREYEGRTDLAPSETGSPASATRARRKNEAISYPPRAIHTMSGTMSENGDGSRSGSGSPVRGEDEADPSLRFPARYRSHLLGTAPVFGPDAADAICRDDRRTRRLTKNAELRQYFRDVSAMNEMAAANSRVPLGSEPALYEQVADNVPRIAVGSRLNTPRDSRGSFRSAQGARSGSLRSVLAARSGGSFRASRAASTTSPPRTPRE